MLALVASAAYVVEYRYIYIHMQNCVSLALFFWYSTSPENTLDDTLADGTGRMNGSSIHIDTGAPL